MNDRAKRRLELARDILALEPSLTPNEVLQIIQAREPKERDSLRSAADWVEEYESHEGRLMWGE